MWAPSWMRWFGNAATKRRKYSQGSKANGTYCKILCI
eukprot:gene30832-41016_t